MEVESQQPKPTTNKYLKLSLITLNFTLVTLGATCAPLLIRLYFLHGGSRKWLTSCIQTAGFPVILIPSSFSYVVSGQNSNLHLPAKSRTCILTLPLLLATAFVGVLIGFLPVSTSSLINSTQLGFTAGFSFLIPRQRFRPYSINAVALPIVGAVILGINAKGGRPEGEGRGQYYVGFVMMLGSASRVLRVGVAVGGVGL